MSNTEWLAQCQDVDEKGEGRQFLTDTKIEVVKSEHTLMLEAKAAQHNAELEHKSRAEMNAAYPTEAEKALAAQLHGCSVQDYKPGL